MCQLNTEPMTSHTAYLSVTGKTVVSHTHLQSLYLQRDIHSKPFYACVMSGSIAAAAGNRIEETLSALFSF